MGPYEISAQLTALIAVGALALVTRWVFSSSRRRSGPPIDASASAELGLLTVVVSGVGRGEALRHRAVLGESDIRSSMSRRHDGTMDVLVFHADADRARILLGRL
ncbi:MAG: hypothetical protein M3Y44_02485 [Actinomycetota bacterium]|nr:hypothetical protein [Actinomycetota bacterium]